MDEIVLEEDAGKAFFKLYFYVEDNFKEMLGESLPVETIAKDLNFLIVKYKNSGLDLRSISKIINSSLEETILNNLEV